MLDKRRLDRRIIRAIQDQQDEGVTTGKVYNVDPTTQTARVRVAGSTSATSMSIGSSEMTSQLYREVSSGNTPSVLHNGRTITDVSGSTYAGVSSRGTSVIESPGRSGGAPSPHDLGGSHHTGIVRDDQIPQAFLVDGSRPISNNVTLLSGVTIDGMDPSSHIANENAHHQKFIGITTDFGDTALADSGGFVGISSINHYLSVNASGNDIYLGVTASDNPGASASILATNSSGRTTVRDVYVTHDLDLTGATIRSTGDITFDPLGNDILPNRSYAINWGRINNKWAALWASELYVETLVAQDKIGTIGGHVLVGPTTILVSDLLPEHLSITVKHNNLVIGDTVYLEGNGQVEFMRVTSGPDGIGPYTYGVQRYINGGTT